MDKRELQEYIDNGDWDEGRVCDEIPNHLSPQLLADMNKAKVSIYRLMTGKCTYGKVECFLMERINKELGFEFYEMDDLIIA